MLQNFSKNKKRAGVFLLITLCIFLTAFVLQRNFEAIPYIGGIVFWMFLVIKTSKKVRYTDLSIWGLSLWAMLHLAGGAVLINGQKLYTILLVPITSDILRFDQAVHAFGFFVATLVMYDIMCLFIQKPIKHWFAFGVVLVMAGLGVGALNEILEFGITLLVPETAIGGYVNTSLDLVADFVGAFGAFGYVYWHERVV